MPKRTLLITPYFDAALPSGGVLFSVDVVREWLADGREVTVLCSRRERSLADLQSFAEAGQLDLHEVASPAHVRFTHHVHPQVYERARAAIEAFRPEVIHIHNTQGMLAAILCALDWRDRRTQSVQPCRVLLTALDFGLLCLNHYLDYGGPEPCSGPDSAGKCARCVRRTLRGSARWASATLPRRLTRRIWPDFVRLDQVQSAAELHPMMRSMLQRLDAIIAPSPVMAEQMSLCTGANAVHEVLYGVNPAKMQRPRKTASSVARLSYLGSAEPVKGLQVLIEAAAGLPDGLPLEIRGLGNVDVGRRIAAAPPAARRYLSYAPALLGPDLAAEHARIDAVVVPSIWHENSPFVVLESLANGTPVVASATAGIRHLIEPERNGLLVRPGSVEAWASALERCACEPAMLSCMSAGAAFTRTTADFVSEIEQFEAAESRPDLPDLESRHSGAVSGSDGGLVVQCEGSRP